MSGVKINLQLFGQTKISNLVNPEVMAGIIKGKLPKKIRFSPIAKIDTTLSGQPGNSIKVPKYAYIGDAADIAEGVAMDTAVLSASTTEATIKKAGKAVELTDEAVLSGYGDPVGEANAQLGLSIASKIDIDCLEALNGAVLTYDGTATEISYEAIVKAVTKFGEEDFQIPKVIFVHPTQIETLRLDPMFKDINQYPLQTVMTGVIGAIAGCQVVISGKVKPNTAGTAYINPIVMTGYDEEDPAALTIYMKRDVSIESARDILAKTTVITADEHYTCVLSNDSKVVKAEFKK